jgi:hypothetical protein
LDDDTVLPPLLMAIFAIWTVKNIRGVCRVPLHSEMTNTGTAVVGRPYTLQAKDQQLIRMLLMEIILFVVCKCPVTIFLIYQQISCYTNILVSKTFRVELKHTVANAYHFFFH